MAEDTQRTLVIDRGTGWPIPEGGPLVLDEGGSLTLRPLPGRAEPFGGAMALVSWACPAALARDRRGRLFVLDATTSTIAHVVVRPDSGTDVLRIDPLPTIGGVGGRPRQLRDPRGLAVLPSGALAVADTANHRVQVFSPSPYALLKVWGATDALGRPAAGTGPREFRSPWGLAVDSMGVLYVADRGNSRIQRIRGGTSLPDIQLDLPWDPTGLAVGPDGTLAVVDSQTPAVWLISPARKLPRALDEVEHPTSVIYGPDGTLYVGDAFGRIHVLARKAPGSTIYEGVGVGVTGLDGAVVDLLWWEARTPRLVVIIEGPSGRRPWNVDPTGGRAVEGAFIWGPLDSGIDRCQWHRVLLHAAVPAGSSIRIESFTAAADDVRPPAEGPVWMRSMLAGSDDPDGLVQSEPGQYLWLRLTLRSNGQQAPVVRDLRVSYPRAGYLRYLPAVFQEDEESRRFLERFLAIFQSGFDDLDARLDQITHLLDPYRVPAKYLRWLAGWLALVIDPAWTEQKIRDQIAAAVATYRIRGTAAGLRAAIRAYADVEARILEHFRLRRWVRLGRTGTLDGAAPLWSRDVYQRLQVTSYSQIGHFRLTSRPEPPIEALDWGANRFSVFFQSDPYRLVETRARVARIVEREKPAHTEATLCPVLPRLRVGVQASVGIDTAIGSVSYLVLNQLATLSYDSILGCSLEEQTLRALGSAVRPTLGVTTRLA